MTPPEYGRTLTGASLNYLVRDVERSLPFYIDLLGFRSLYSDPDFAALEGHGIKVQLHADHIHEFIEKAHHCDSENNPFHMCGRKMHSQIRAFIVGDHGGDT